MKKLAAVAVFAATLALAILVTRYYGPQPLPPPPPPGSVDAIPPPPPSPPVSQPEITHRTQLVTLDLAARKYHTTLVLERDASGRAPERVWVWTAFFTPGEGRGRVFATEPVELRRPFASGNRATVNVTGAAWHADAGIPVSYYARVYVSTESAAAARRPDEEVSRDISIATPVVVEHGLQRNR